MTEPDTFNFSDDGAIPNSGLPLLVYRRALPADPGAQTSERHPPCQPAYGALSLCARARHCRIVR